MLAGHRYGVVPTDIADRGWGTPGVDLFQYLAAGVEGRVALLVRFQWIAGRRAAALMSAAPFAAVIALTKRIQWFDTGELTNTAQHHHAWIVFDHAHPRGAPPALLFAGEAEQPDLFGG